jgi:hypothetical protein
MTGERAKDLRCNHSVSILSAEDRGPDEKQGLLEPSKPTQSAPSLQAAALVSISYRILLVKRAGQPNRKAAHLAGGFSDAGLTWWRRPLLSHMVNRVR